MNKRIVWLAALALSVVGFAAEAQTITAVYALRQTATRLACDAQTLGATLVVRGELDQGEGSGAPVGKIASGAYNAGFGDINAIINLAATKPQDAPVGVYMMYNIPPFVIAANRPKRTAIMSRSRATDGRCGAVRSASGASSGLLEMLPSRHGGW